MSGFLTDVRDAVRTLEHDVEKGFRALRGKAEEERPQEPALPQADPNRAAREQQLAKAREDFVFSYSFAPPLPNVAGLPPGQDFTTEYNLGFAPTVLSILENQVEALDWFFRAHPHLKPDLTAIPQLIRSWATGPLSFLNSSIFTETSKILLRGEIARAESAGDFRALYKKLPVPPVSTEFDEDWTFGYMRLGGFNPTVIRRVDALPGKFPLSDALFAKVLGQELTLEAAAKDGRLYLCDYGVLDGLPGGKVHGLRKYPAAPIALFCWMPGGLDGGSLMPVAIQLGQSPSEETPIFTPLDGVRWKIAKAFVQSADGNHHQAIAHLFQTHLRVEPVIVATVRELAANHPLHVLLAPHFAFTIAINNDARNQLLAENGVVDRLLGPTIEGSKTAIVRAAAEWRFDEMAPEASFRCRGVDDPALLPAYPYRDDTLLLWESIQRFVDRYVELYYHGPQDMAADWELQKWAQALISPDGARFAGMSIRPGEPFADLAYLKRVCAQVIYTASAQHAAVNYAQYPMMSFVPNCPLAMYGPPPTRTSKETESTWLLRMPPVSMTLWQMSVADLLSSRQPTRLCQYAKGTFTDPRVEGVLASTQAELVQVEATIVERNNRRRFPYAFQLPSRVPNSILI